MKSVTLFRVSIVILLVNLSAVAFAAQIGSSAAQKGSSMEIDRISVIEARKWVKMGDALLVCSYEDNRCKTMLLEGAILKSEFESKLPSLPKTQPIIFYCA